MVEKDLINVTFPEPVGRDVVLFEEKMDSRIYAREELEARLFSASQRLDLVIADLMSRNDLSCLDYDLTIYSAPSGDFVEDIISGGGNIGMDRWWKTFILEHIQKDGFGGGYLDVFPAVVRAYDSTYPIFANMFIRGYRDSVPVVVKARNPDLI